MAAAARFAHDFGGSDVAWLAPLCPPYFGFCTRARLDLQKIKSRQLALASSDRFIGHGGRGGQRNSTSLPNHHTATIIRILQKCHDSTSDPTATIHTPSPNAISVLKAWFHLKQPCLRGYGEWSSQRHEQYLRRRTPNQRSTCLADLRRRACIAMELSSSSYTAPLSM